MPTTGAPQCLACDPGSYCSLTGLSAPTGKCDAGYYCGFGATTPRPTDGNTGNLCPVGFFCPAGSAVPRTCPDGTRTLGAGQTTCAICPAGKSCRASLEASCDNYKYCSPREALDFPYGRLCPSGSYLDPDERGATDSSSCKACPPGKFCLAGRVTGNCVAGYVCASGAGSPEPSTPVVTPGEGAYPCPIGYYCPAGSLIEKPCDSGLYTYHVGAR
jgi:hypothetical protein